MASFKLLTGISPSLGFLLLRIKISRLNSPDKTKLKVNDQGCVVKGSNFFSANMVIIVIVHAF